MAHRHAGGLALLLTLALAGPAAADSSHTIVAGQPSKSCRSDYPTISAAVAAASPGDTVKVCPGDYHESVSLTKALTLLGAQNGDARSKGRQTADPSKESVVHNDGGAGAFHVYSSNVTINGFTILGTEAPDSNGNYPQDANYPDAGLYIHSGSGPALANLTITNDVFKYNGLGLYADGTAGESAAAIEHDAFLYNNRGYGAFDGDPAGGMFTCCDRPGLANSSINENLFAFNDQFGMNIGGGSSGGLQINNNLDTDEFTMLVIGHTTGAEVANNQTQRLGGSAIYLFGDNSQLDIANNQLNGRNDPNGGNGISFHMTFGATQHNDQMTVENNKVTGFPFNGFNIRDATNSLFRNNQVNSNNADGILAGTPTAPGELVSNNTFQSNQAKNNATFDCEDQTHGSGTDLTANLWINDHGLTSSPPDLCKK